MSKGGERVQGKPGSPIPLGYGRGVCSSVSDFATPIKDFNKWRNYAVSGVTKDSTGTPLGGCTVDVFESNVSEPRRFVGRAVSDANGNYSIMVNGPDTGMTFEAVAYLAGAPDRAGVTVNTLAGTEL